ncbi:MAG: hypothetical protein ACI4LB_04160 [Candidatus Fimenecus sp.]
MDIIMHYPKTEQGKTELHKKVAEVHIEAVNRYLSQLPCPKAQKVAILRSVEEELHAKKT